MPQTYEQRFANRNARFYAKVEWFGDRVAQNIRIGMAQRIRLAVQLLRDKTVINISKPVRKYMGPISGRTQVDPASRSKPGEFPKADTTRLMKDVFYEARGMEGRIGTTLDYGLILETKMDRSFLRRTMTEMRPTITRLLVSGRGGGGNVRFPGDTYPER